MIVYLVFKNGECVYVGQTVLSLAQRKGKHLSEARKGRGSILGAAIRKHGEEVFGFIEYIRCKTQAELDYAEKSLITELKPRYNVQEGGKFNFTPWNKGKTEVRPEVLKAISIAAKNRKRTKRGKYSPEHVKKISQASLSRAERPFYCEQTGEIFYNKITCANAYKLNPRSLSVLLSGKTRLKSLRGLTFCYLTLAQSKPTLIDLETQKQGDKAEDKSHRERLNELAEKSDAIV